MVEQQEMTGEARHMELEMKFNEACAYLDAGHHREAFRLFQEAARAGHRASWLNVGYCFDVGLGVRRSRERALFWYRKAASKGFGAAAGNIGTVYRDEGRPRLAARWFLKAVSLGTDHGPRLTPGSRRRSGRSWRLALRRPVAGNGPFNKGSKRTHFLSSGLPGFSQRASDKAILVVHTSRWQEG